MSHQIATHLHVFLAVLCVKDLPGVLSSAFAVDWLHAELYCQRRNGVERPCAGSLFLHTQYEDEDCKSKVTMMTTISAMTWEVQRQYLAAMLVRSH